MSTFSMRVELGIDAQRIIQQIQINNQSTEEVITRAVEKAFKDISEESNFEILIYENTKLAIEEKIKEISQGWKVKMKIQDAIEKALGKEIDLYAEKVAEKLLAEIKQKG